MRRLIFLASSLAVFSLSAPAVQEAAPADTPDLAEILRRGSRSPAVTRMLSWRDFINSGFTEPAKVFEASSDDLKVAEAIHDSLEARLKELVETQKPMRLTGYGNAKIQSQEKGQLRLLLAKQETTVPLSDVASSDLVLMLRKAKDKTETDYAAIATLAQLGKDAKNVRSSRNKVKGDLAAPLEHWLAGSAELSEEMHAAMEIERVSRLGEDPREIEKTWPGISSSETAGLVRSAFRQQYKNSLLRSTSPDELLANGVQGEITTTPAKDGGELKVELHWDFADEDQLQDFEITQLSERLKSVVRWKSPWYVTPEEHHSWTPVEGEDRVVNGQSSLVRSRLPFTAVHEIEVRCRLAADSQAAHERSCCWFGVEDPKDQSFACVLNLWRLFADGPQGRRTTGHKDILTPSGETVECILKFDAPYTTVMRNKDQTARQRDLPAPAGHLILLGAGNPSWEIDDIVVRGSLSTESVDQIIAAEIERRAVKLFGE